jgi:hypothetical protein
MEVSGAFAQSPIAAAFAGEVRRVHGRYAREVVAEFRVCPFLRDIETGFGRFCVVLDRQPDVERAVQLALAGDGISHLVFPLATVGATTFERFGAGVGNGLRHALATAPVIATFHPQLSGDSSTPHRLVGLLRRAPDPFVQLVPAGLHQGGTVFAGAGFEPTQDPAQDNFRRLVGSTGGELARLLAILEDVRADRDRSYAPFLEALAAG